MRESSRRKAQQVACCQRRLTDTAGTAVQGNSLVPLLSQQTLSLFALKVLNLSELVVELTGEQLCPELLGQDDVDNACHLLVLFDFRDAVDEPLAVHLLLRICQNLTSELAPLEHSQITLIAYLGLLEL